MKKKLTYVAALAAAGALALTGCGKNETPQQNNDVTTEAANTQTGEGDLLSQILDKGEIVVAMEGTWAPWTYHDEDDNLVGYDVEVAQQIAEKLGVKATFVEGEWDGLLAGIDSGRYDIMVNGVDITEERAEKYSFSDPYAYNRTAVIVNSAMKSSPWRISTERAPRTPFPVRMQKLPRNMAQPLPVLTIWSRLSSFS